MGEFETWTRAEYEAETQRVRSTSLKKLIDAGQGPARYYRDVVLRSEFEDVLDEDERKMQETSNRTLMLGTLLHEWVLEGQQNWYVSTERRGTKAWKDELDEHEGSTPVKPAEDKKLRMWREAVFANHHIRALLEKGGLAEQTILWDEMDLDGSVIPCKARLDFMTHDQWIVDLKTTRAQTRDEFERQVRELHYDFSAAFYARGFLSTELGVGMAITDVTFLHLAVMSDGNGAWAYLWPLGPDWMRIGEAKVKRALVDLAECKKRHEAGCPPEVAWPDRMVGSQLHKTVPPPWMIEEAQQLSARPIWSDE